jgi:TfoX/Sxy family transcriptional regulator of competence genes
VASTIEFVEHVCEQIGNAGAITYKRMFGEFGLYCDAKFIGVICDNQFFLKETERGRALLTEPHEAPPYPGAKPHFLIGSLEDKANLSILIKETCDALPMPAPRKKRRTSVKK